MNSKIKINPKIIKQRTAILRDVSLNKKDSFHKKFYGKTLSFLSLSNGQAISSNYIKGNIIYGANEITASQDEREDYYETDEIRHAREIPPNTFFEGMLIEKDGSYEQNEGRCNVLFLKKSAEV